MSERLVLRSRFRMKILRSTPFTLDECSLIIRGIDRESASVFSSSSSSSYLFFSFPFHSTSLPLCLPSRKQWRERGASKVITGRFVEGIQPRRASINDKSHESVSGGTNLSVICVVAHFTSDRFTARFIIPFEMIFLFSSLSIPSEIEFSLVAFASGRKDDQSSRGAH